MVYLPYAFWSENSLSKGELTQAVNLDTQLILENPVSHFRKLESLYRLAIYMDLGIWTLGLMYAKHFNHWIILPARDKYYYVSFPSGELPSMGNKRP